MANSRTDSTTHRVKKAARKVRSKFSRHQVGHTGVDGLPEKENLYLNDLRLLKRHQNPDEPPGLPATTDTQTFPRIDRINDDNSNVPDDWTWHDRDLDPEDIDANIERCERRIKQNILPTIWARRLADYQAKRKKLHNMVIVWRPITDPAIIKRLGTLRYLENNLLANVAPVKEAKETKETKETKEGKANDKGKKFDYASHLPNIKAIIAAYQAGTLAAPNGTTVTYWSCGTLVQGPEEFDEQRYRECAEANRGEVGFWVEGGEGVNPLETYAVYDPNCLQFTSWPNTQQGLHMMKFAVRVPGAAEDRYFEFDFLDDTGSSIMLIYQDDIVDLQELSGRNCPLLNTVGLKALNRGLITHTYRVEVNIINAWGNPVLQDWVSVQCGIHPGERRELTDRRISGPWMRHVLFTGTCPTNGEKLYVGPNKTSVIDMLRSARAPGIPPKLLEEYGVY